MKHWSDRLVKISACPDAVAWCRAQPSLAAAWRSCQRGDWMLWLAGKLCRSRLQRKRLVLVACAVAREALVHVPVGEERPRIAIETAELWCRGKATFKEVQVAAYAAYAAASASSASAAYASAYASAAASAYAAWAAASAADAAYAAAYAAADAARGRSLARSADLVRQHYPSVPRLAARKKRVGA